MLDFLEILASIVTFKASLGMDIFRYILKTCVQSFEASEDVGNFLPKKEILSWNEVLTFEWLKYMNSGNSSITNRKPNLNKPKGRIINFKV